MEDDSVLRRGVPVAHKIFGVAQTINSANYVYFLALQELSKLNNPALITIYTGKLSENRTLGETCIDKRILLF